VRGAQKVGWFDEGDPIALESEAILFNEAPGSAQREGLAIYPPVQGPQPYEDGLPGWLIVARGDFYDVVDGELPGQDTDAVPPWPWISWTARER
jgi:hypothetical protein